MTAAGAVARRRALPALRPLVAGAAAILAGASAGALLWLAVGSDDPLTNPETVEVPKSRVVEPLAAPVMPAAPAPPPLDERADPVLDLAARESDFLAGEVHSEVAAPPPEPLVTGAGDLGEAAPWRRYAVAVAETGEAPRIALVIDDLGLNRPNTRRAIALPAPLTLAFMTYAEGLQELAAAARARGHELIVHFPMAPSDAAHDPGPEALRLDLSPEELARRLDWGLGRFEGYVGINNHMGSGFTSWRPGMEQVMAEVKARGLLYLDSMTTADSLGVTLAARLGVPHARRDIFIDNEAGNRAAIRRQLARLEERALRRGSAVGIGHPHDLTLEELARWIPEVRRRGFHLVPISAVVRTGTDLAIVPKSPTKPG
jgi:polysaccharide deacetylase 2 family uncharacterized protein YibQ